MKRMLAVLLVVGLLMGACCTAAVACDDTNEIGDNTDPFPYGDGSGGGVPGPTPCGGGNGNGGGAPG